MWMVVSQQHLLQVYYKVRNSGVGMHKAHFWNNPYRGRHFNKHSVGKNSTVHIRGASYFSSHRRGLFGQPTKRNLRGRSRGYIVSFVRGYPRTKESRTAKVIRKCGCKDRRERKGEAIHVGNPTEHKTSGTAKGYYKLGPLFRRELKSRRRWGHLEKCKAAGLRKD